MQLKLGDNTFPANTSRQGDFSSPKFQAGCQRGTYHPTRIFQKYSKLGLTPLKYKVKYPEKIGKTPF